MYAIVLNTGVIAQQILREIRSRLQFLMDVGLQYLTLSRAAGTLSGGESQRIRLATQIGSSLMGVLYILDEPEAALSPMRLLTLISELDRLVNNNSQIIIATHSPILMAYPDAEIIELTDNGICKKDYFCVI